MLRENCYKRTKKVDENIQDYVLNVPSKCNRVDKIMQEKQIIKFILKGLPDEIFWKIESKDNYTADKITLSLKMFESNQTMTTPNYNKD